MNTLGHAASGYTKAVEENRKLYNQVQDLKGKTILHAYCKDWLLFPDVVMKCFVLAFHRQYKGVFLNKTVHFGASSRFKHCRKYR